MPGIDGLAATELSRTQDDAPKAIVLTAFRSATTPCAPAPAGLLKDTPPADILRAVAAGETTLSPRHAG